jgi:hypothetical protein
MEEYRDRKPGGLPFLAVANALIIALELHVLAKV